MLTKYPQCVPLSQDTQRRQCPHPTVVGLRAIGTLDCLTVTVEDMELPAVNGEGLFFALLPPSCSYIPITSGPYASGQQREYFYQKPSDFYVPWIETEQNPGLESWERNTTIRLFPGVTVASSLPTFHGPVEVSVRIFSCVKFYFLAPIPFLSLFLPG